MRSSLVLTGILALFVNAAHAQEQPNNVQDPLPSWNDGPTKSSIVAFVARVTTPDSPDFVPLEERIATFDNDGTLWSEQPIYFQLSFAIDRVKALAPQHPEWKEQEPYKTVLAGDLSAVADIGKLGLFQLMMTAHAGMTQVEFEATVDDWIRTARHPRFNRPYTDLVFQPMLELISYLRANGFQVWIVSGGGIDFLRVWAPRVYGIPKDRIVGSSIKTEFELRDGKPVLVRKPAVNFVNDKGGKPVGINRFIGRRPIAAFGNSDGDLQMLQWSTSGSGKRFGMVVHHTDAKREWAYDRTSAIGHLDKALDAAQSNGWTVADMQRDWNVIYPFQRVDHHYFHKGNKGHAAEWSYSGATGPEHWGDLDPSYVLAKLGRQQSPVDIRSPAPRELPKIGFNYKPSRIHLVYNGHTIQENQDAGSFAMEKGRSFALEQFHFHSPSEHTVNGHQFPMEMHLVHKASDGTVGVVAVLIEQGQHNSAFDPLWENLPGPARSQRDSQVTIDVGKLLPKEQSYYRYRGSFTTPPCTEHVEWVILTQPVHLSNQQIARFRKVIDGNNRPIQRLNGREIELSE